MRKNPQLPNVSGKYGAPMGRGTFIDDASHPCRVFRLRFVDGCYDEGGAYWGSPANVYACISEGVQLFTRAASRKLAKAHFLTVVPVRFVN